MARITLRTVRRIHELVRLDHVVLTQKALEDLAALPEALTRDDVRTILAGLSREDCVQRVLSSRTREWLYVFKTTHLDLFLYIKVVLRDDCVVISFHEDR